MKPIQLFRFHEVLFSRGGLLDGLLEPQFMRQFRQEPCNYEVNSFFPYFMA
jgi:hypothetical protein